MFKTILVATDGSDQANKALDAALDLARLNGASLTILTATEPMPASRAARMMRTAISPRLAIRTFVMRGMVPQPKRRCMADACSRHTDRRGSVAEIHSRPPRRAEARTW